MSNSGMVGSLSMSDSGVVSFRGRRMDASSSKSWSIMMSGSLVMDGSSMMNWSSNSFMMDRGGMLSLVMSGSFVMDRCSVLSLVVNGSVMNLFSLMMRSGDVFGLLMDDLVGIVMGVLHNLGCSVCWGFNMGDMGLLDVVRCRCFMSALVVHWFGMLSSKVGSLVNWLSVMKNWGIKRFVLMSDGLLLVNRSSVFGSFLMFDGGALMNRLGLVFLNGIGLFRLFSHELLKERLRNLNIFDMSFTIVVAVLGRGLLAKALVRSSLGANDVSILGHVSSILLTVLRIADITGSLSVHGLAVMRLLVHVTRLLSIHRGTIVLLVRLLIIWHIDVSISFFFGGSFDRS